MHDRSNLQYHTKGLWRSNYGYSTQSCAHRAVGRSTGTSTLNKSSIGENELIDLSDVSSEQVSHLPSK
ncbi:unnamed protein product [Ilex paraguariensis]|uniref:Uncharacterized protein n=1 Tax=Ilex paraguariensis TaxID=185542 RepID=A0ABC8RQJ9_9AQUA